MKPRRAWGEASRIALTGPSRSAMRASAIGNQTRRVDAFSDPSKKRFYVAFLNDLLGTGTAWDGLFGIEGQGHRRVPNGAPDHEREILRDLNDTAFRNIGCN